MNNQAQPPEENTMERTIPLNSIDAETREAFAKELDGVKNITRDCREDMHEPDEQGVTAHVYGRILDNAGVTGELTVILERENPDRTARQMECKTILLDNLIAIARTVDLRSVPKEAAALAEDAPVMLEVLRELYKHCEMIHKHWGGGGKEAADRAIEAGQELLDKHPEPEELGDLGSVCENCGAAARYEPDLILCEMCDELRTERDAAN